ncbi:glycosyltransferase [Alcanivorax sp. DP30]|uniref:glycosyltransferase family 2 protein n=1 Tax=Alcanivorax sp. DP30 TaxID=2606217 RepID=UPI00136ACE93|nr:glycosyltransferase [Alcanivorax sp. DP30]MZR64143.1 glycosyltransferase [Alcanivorax sp. DP30]
MDVLTVGSQAPRPPEPLPESDIMAYWSNPEDKPVVSILCHCFNHELFLEDTLNGFLMQKTDFPWEIIVHDDASTDNSADIIRRYAEAYPSIIKPILQEENQFSQGLRPTFFTTKAALGEYFAPCDADDYWLDPDKLQRQADFLSNNPKYAVCGHNAFIVESGTVVKTSKLPPINRADVSAKRLSQGWFILTFTTMFRRDYDWYPEEHSKVVNGDAFFFSRLGKVGGYKYLSDIKLGAYRAHPGGVWSALDQQSRDATTLNSAYWMSQYYKRIGDRSLSFHYAQKVSLTALESLDVMSIPQLLYFNWKLIRQMIKKRFRFLAQLLNKQD